MYKVCILLCFLVFTKCFALENTVNAEIVNYEFDNIGTGAYHFSYETSDGTKRDEVGELHYPNTDDETEVVTGSFSFVGADGVVYTVRYKADDQGFHPEGDHIKVPPFVPWIHHHHDNPNQSNSGKGSSTTPHYETGERILDIFRTTPRPIPTPQYLPSASTKSPSTTPHYKTGERILDTFRTTSRPTPTSQYLPSASTESIVRRPTPSNLGIQQEQQVTYQNPVVPNPEITLHSQAQASLYSGSRRFRRHKETLLTRMK